MKLALCNIAWLPEEDEQVYRWMKQYGFSGVEIAPTRIVGTLPYERLKAAKIWQEEQISSYGFSIPSMQSIWYGKSEGIFGSDEARKFLLQYSQRALLFAKTVYCPHLVFGCPKNRVIPAGMTCETVEKLAVNFFRELGESANTHNIVIGMEANPQIYGTNFINTTLEAFKLVQKVDSIGFRINLDVGTMIQNEECPDYLCGKVKTISHVHISEPHLAPIRQRGIHQDLAQCLKEEGYKGFISIEMARPESLSELEEAMHYVREIFSNDDSI